MYKSFIVAALFAISAVAQTQPAGQSPGQATAQPTAAEQLQRGIFLQETSGDLDGAAKIYRQIVDSHPAQREIAAQAQYRLGITLLQKGDAALAAQEIQRLSWDFPNYKELIDSAKKAGGPTPLGELKFSYVYGPGNGDQAATERAAKIAALEAAGVAVKQPAAEDHAKYMAQHDAEFDFSRSTMVTGSVTMVQWINPIAWLTVSAGPAQTYHVSLDSPNSLVGAGWTRNTVPLGGQVVLNGAPAKDGSSTLQATSVSLAGKVIFTRSATPQ
jgi:hypothetical protein